jgi:hypothetical protein
MKEITDFIGQVYSFGGVLINQSMEKGNYISL